MKKIYLILAAAIGMTITSCTNDDIVEDNSGTGNGTDKAIVFGSLSKGMTRADFTGADAASKLGNKFVVSAKKGSTTAATTGDITFNNYVVEYAENTAHTTASNSSNWEYVGKTPIDHATTNGITSQTIKYWDYSAAQYDFIAWSTGSKSAIYSGTPGSGQVLVSAINPNATATAAVTFTGAAEDLQECYISDITTVKKNAYGDEPVMMKFRSLGAKVRIAIYETIPGYSVKNVKFYTAANVALADDATDDTPRLFTTVANEIYTKGTYTVTFPTVDDPSSADNNLAHVSFSGDGTQSTIVDFGNMNLTIAEEGEKTSGAVFLGRTSNTASFAGDPEKNYYTAYLPNEAGTNLNLRVNFTLEAIDGGAEKIEVKGATAQVPSIYTQWKAGYAYTYVFKISDKTNGHTGVYDPTKPDDTTVNSDPAGLYPITFDAVVVNAEDTDKTQETITLVATPSITTYQKGSNVVNNNEYLATTGDIFVTVNDGGGYVEVTGLTAGVSSVSDYYTYNTTTGKYTKCGSSDVAADGTKYYRLDPVLANGALQTLTSKVALYTIPAGKTEAEVIDALQMQDDDATPGTIKGRSGLVLTAATKVATVGDIDAANKYTLTNSVEYGVDGNAISVSTDQALRFKPAATTTYAFVYTKTAPSTTTDKFQPVTKAAGASVDGLYRYALVAAAAGDTQKGITYFGTSDASANAITAFIGQGVSNLYTRSGAGTPGDPHVYSIASGYAVTGTTYYYTLDNGLSYIAATSVAYSDFEGATLYHDAAMTEAKSETKPLDGQAYYDNTGKYCVIMPQQTTGLYIIDTAADKVACGATNAVTGMTYFDKYTQNDGVYYTKVIKVQ